MIKQKFFIRSDFSEKTQVGNSRNSRESICSTRLPYFFLCLGGLEVLSSIILNIKTTLKEIFNEILHIK